MPITTNPLDVLLKQRAILVGYLQSKVDAQDWHGVADAAMDLREMDIAIGIRKGQQRVEP